MFIIDLHPVLRNICGSVAFFVLGGVSHIRIADVTVSTVGHYMRSHYEIMDWQILVYCCKMEFAPMDQMLSDFQWRLWRPCTYAWAFTQKQSPCSTSASLLNTFWVRWSWEPLPSTEEWTVNGQIGGQCRGAWLIFGTRKDPLSPETALAVLTSPIMDFTWKQFWTIFFSCLKKSRSRTNIYFTTYIYLLFWKISLFQMSK